MTTPGKNQLSSVNDILMAQGLDGLATTSVSAPRKIKINRILIKAEIRKCFAGHDWESQETRQIETRICEKLSVYGRVDEEVIEKVAAQVRKKLEEHGRDPDSPLVGGGDAIPEEVNLYSTEAKEQEPEVNLYGDPANQPLLFSQPPEPRVISPRDALKQMQQDQKVDDVSSDEEDLYAPQTENTGIFYNWTIEKLQKTISLQLAGAVSWRTVIQRVEQQDPNYTSKIAVELYSRISAANKPFSHEEVGQMALDALDKKYIEIDTQKKRDPTTSRAAAPMISVIHPPPQPQVIASAAFASAEGIDDGVISDSVLVDRLRKENSQLRTQLEKEREQNKVYLAEINKLKTTLVTVETNAQTMSQLLEQKQNEVRSEQMKAKELTSRNLDIADESLAVQAQMEEIRQFAIRSQQQNRISSQSVAVARPAPPPSSGGVKPIAVAKAVQSEPNLMQNEGVAIAQPAPAAREAAQSMFSKVDSTIPVELHSVHFPDPNTVGPWQSTTSYAKTKRGTTKAIVTWTLVDANEKRHVVTLEHNHYSFRGVSKRKVVIDNIVAMSEKSANLTYPFQVGPDKVTVLISSGANGFEYQLMVNDLSFTDAKNFNREIQEAMRASMIAEN